ncbi:MAG TPA: MoaD/ThiS family protein [Bacteroidota bacterium]|nr:MoaD/ThiS family protein [Bacteroidota bacterium]
MAVKVLIPTPLRAFTERKDAIVLEGSTVGELLDKLTTQHAQLKKHLYADDGSLRNFVNVYVNNEDIRYLKNEETSVTEKDVVSIIPSIAGGGDLL